MTRRVAMPWFEPGQYRSARAIMSDADKLPADHDLWAMSANQVAQELERAGLVIVRVLIEPDAFTDWCRERGIPADSKARHAYAEASLGEAS